MPLRYDLNPDGSVTLHLELQQGVKLDIPISRLDLADIVRGLIVGNGRPGPSAVKPAPAVAKAKKPGPSPGPKPASKPAKPAAKSKAPAPALAGKNPLGLAKPDSFASFLDHFSINPNGRGAKGAVAFAAGYMLTHLGDAKSFSREDLEKTVRTHSKLGGFAVSKNNVTDWLGGYFRRVARGRYVLTEKAVERLRLVRPVAKGDASGT